MRQASVRYDSFICTGVKRIGVKLCGLVGMLLAVSSSVLAANAVIHESAEQSLTFRPARMLFFEGLYRQSNSYHVIATLPSAHELVESRDNLAGTDLLDADRFGPANPRLSWIRWSGERYGMALGSNYSSDAPASGIPSEILTPLAVSFYFQPNRLIFVPSYQYGVARTDDAGAGESTAGYLDLYMLYLAPSGMRWLSIDPAVQRDFQTRRTTYSFEFEAGHTISSVFGEGGVYARPGVAIAEDRPHDWNVEVGIRLNY